MRLPWRRDSTADAAPPDRAEPAEPAEQPDTGVEPLGESVERADAPAPDHPAKPDSPTDLTKPTWTYLLRKTVREFSRDQATDLAAALTYYAVLAVAPALIALVSLLSLVGQSERAVEGMLDVARDLAPTDAVDTVEPIIDQVTANQGAGLGLALGLVGALWSASAFVAAFSRAMNRIYEIDEGRPIWKLRPILLLLTLVALGMLALVAVGLVVTGPVARAIGNAVGLGEEAVQVWETAKWPVVLVLVAVIIALLYHVTPNVRQPKFRWISVGASVAIAVWALGSAGFGLYVSRFGTYDATYGSLAGVVVFLLWLWLSNMALLFGAELDAELERGRQLQAGIAAEERIQLPPRDTAASEKKAAKAAEDVAIARALRESAGSSR